MFVDNRYVSPDTWYDEKGKAFQPGVHYFVGGATKLYGAALYRLRKEDFGELHHHDGISPAWPVSYDVFEPYYTLAEQHYEVHGARGEDPTEPPASAPYPHPAVSHEPRIQQLADQLEAAGYHPFHAPCGIMLDESNPPFSTCIRCATCDGFPCLVHAKSDAEVLGVRPALEHANVTLLTNRKVVGSTPTTRAPPSPRSWPTTTGRRSVTRPTWSSCRPVRPTRRRSCSSPRTTSTRMVSRTARIRSAATTCSTTRPPSLPSRGRRTRPPTRRRSGSTTSTSAPTTSSTRSGTSRWSASRRRRCSAASDPGRRSSRPSGRSSAWPSTQSTSGSRPRTCRGPTTG